MDEITFNAEIKWTVSRGRDTYGYNICTLYIRGQKVARCNGGGYDMQGTVFGSWLAYAYADRLMKLKPKDMPAQSHWQRAENPRRICSDVECRLKRLRESGEPDYTQALDCPHCGAETNIDWHDGQTIDDGRWFYGLTFHDPNYDPGKAVIGEDTSDRTLSDGAEGKTVEQAEGEGISFGLERIQAAYRASSKVPTERHTIPSIDGAVGMRSVEQIAEAIGIKFQWINTRCKNQQLYLVHDRYKEEQDAGRS